MSGVLWQLTDNVARLQFPRLRGELDLTRPEFGIARLRADDGLLRADHILGVEFVRPDVALPVPESYCRGGSLEATYAASSTWPVCVQSRWQVADHSATGVLAAIDLVVSVRTELLDAQPELAVTSRLNVREVLRWNDGGNASWLPLQNLPATAGPDRAVGCFIFRLLDQPWSYAEMVHPADFQRSEFRAEADGSTAVRHRLFIQRLEKGVILRARVRGRFLSRDGDLAQAEELYREFAAADPPLSA